MKNLRKIKEKVLDRIFFGDYNDMACIKHAMFFVRKKFAVQATTDNITGGETECQHLTS